MTTETSPSRGSSPVREETREVAGTAQERAGDVGRTARDQAGGVARTAREQTGDVVAHTQAEARDLLGELRTSMREQTRAQRDRIAEVIGGLEEELQQMVDRTEGSGPATEAVRQIAQRMRSWREYLQGDGDAAGDLRAFARRRPGTFLLAAAAAGVVAGRLTRGATSRDDDSGDGSGYGRSAGHELDDDVAGYRGEPGGTAYPGTGYPSTGYPETGYQASEYQAPEYPSSGYQAPEYPSTERPSSEYQAPEYPSTERPSSERPSTEYPSTEYQAPEYPSTEHGAAGYATSPGDTPYGAGPTQSPPGALPDEPEDLPPESSSAGLGDRDVPGKRRRGGDR